MLQVKITGTIKTVAIQANLLVTFKCISNILGKHPRNLCIKKLICVQSDRSITKLVLAHRSCEILMNLKFINLPGKYPGDFRYRHVGGTIRTVRSSHSSIPIGHSPTRIISKRIQKRKLINRSHK